MINNPYSRDFVRKRQVFIILTLVSCNSDRDMTRPNLKIFLFPLTRPCFTGMGLSVGIIFLTSQIGYPLNFIVYSKTCRKRPLQKDDQLPHDAGQKYCRMLPGSILQYFPPSFNLQVLLYSPIIGNKIKYTNSLLRIYFKDYLHRTIL